jgi:hypothetical protein
MGKNSLRTNRAIEELGGSAMVEGRESKVAEILGLRDKQLGVVCSASNGIQLFSN